MDISKSARRIKAQVPPPSDLRTFVKLCRWQVERLNERPAFSHLADDGQTEVHVSYSQWETRIRSIAAVLAEHGNPGDRVLIVQQPGIEYVASLFACMYSGMVAVPVYPPDLFRLRQTLPRLQAITSDAEARIMLSSREVLGDSVGPMWNLVGERAIATDEIEDHWANQFRAPIVRAGDLALLQFTSGSTATPRGVALTHANILANARQGFHAFDVPDAVCVFWLPPYHDLGLIGGMLIPVYGGRHSVLMSPIAFLQQPIRWFEAIHRFRGTTTASPNFGYEWCLRKISIDQCEGLDLSSWKLAAVGAEPVRAGTLQRFADRFSKIGFSYNAFTPGYGMAEATLAITSKPIETGPVVRDFDASNLQAQQPIAVPVDMHEQVGEMHEQANDEIKSVALVSSGQPVRDCEICIVDPVTRQPLPDGYVGEIWVTSPAVASEYWRRPELSTATFNAKIQRANVHDSEQEAYLRTGDLGFLLDNELYVSGRLKEQIIIAGRNFFPHDIEAAIQSSHEAFKVDGGVAFSVDHPDGEHLVIVHEVLRPKRFDLDELAESLRQVVFEETGLVPDCICLVAAASLPKTSSGKLRRLECRRQYLEDELQLLRKWNAGNGNAASISEQLSVPGAGLAVNKTDWTSTERRLEPLWCESLETKRTTKNQHFLEAGGHSLGANHLLSRIRDEFKTNVTLGDLARFPRFGELAAEIERRLDRPDPTSLASETTARQPARQMPLTRSQSRFWVLEQLQRRDAFLHVGVEYQIKGSVDVQRLIECCKTLPARHESLRVAFQVGDDGIPKQTILDHVDVPTSFLDASTVANLDTNQQLQKLISAPFDLSQPPLLRVTIVKHRDDDYRLLVAAHHIIADGWSMGVLISDLSHQYAKDQSAFQSLTNASDWSIAISRMLDGEADGPSKDLFDYWHNRYAGAPVNCSLARHLGNTDVLKNETINPEAESVDSEVIRRPLSVELSDGIEQTARRLGVTTFSVLLTAWHSVLERYLTSSDIILGIPVANRQFCDEESLIGCFINILPFRMNAGDDRRLENKIRSTNLSLLEDLSHATYLSEDVLRESLIHRDDLSTPLVQHLVLQQPKLSEQISFGEAKVVDFVSDYSSLAAYETSLVTESHNHATELTLAYCPRRIPASTAENLLASLIAVLHQIGSHTGQPIISTTELEIPSREEHNRMLALLGGQRSNEARFLSSNSLDNAGPTESFLKLFASHVASNSDAKAVEDQGGAISYAQLDATSARIAKWLRDRGYQSGSRVGVMLERTRILPAVLLGIWKAGAAYVPLDGSQPEARLRNIINDAAPNGIIIDDRNQKILDPISTACSNISLERLIHETTDGSGCPTTSLGGTVANDFLARTVVLSPSDPAYLIFTSGSTGKPKGVVVDHSNVANFLNSMVKRPGLRTGERVLASTTLSFDISVLEIFLPMIVGATSVISPTSLSEDSDAVLKFLASRRIDVIQSTPSSLRLLLALGWQPPTRLRVWSGGEPLPIDLANHLLDEGVELWNMYGPTETTVWSTVGRVKSTRSGRITIGAPVDRTVLRLVDPTGRDVPQGVAGELWIGGAGVSQGYWNQPQLTAQRFVNCRPNSLSETDGLFDVQRYYKTGDLARLNDAGELEILGRSDRQIKLLGHRIELGEIEQQILNHPRIREAAVTVVRSGLNDLQIVCFYTSKADSTLPPESVRDFLRTSLPDVMIPSALIPLASLPLTPAGKIDYQVLPTDQCVLKSGRQENMEQSIRSAPKQSPQTELELAISEIWEEVLQVGGLSIDDHFFRLGGHSLKAAQVIARLRSKFNVAVPLRDMYSHPTIRELAKRLHTLTSEAVPQTATLPTAVPKTTVNEIAAYRTDRSVLLAQEQHLQPLSFAEQRLWFVDRLEPNHPFYNLPLAADLHGPLDINLLNEALNDVVARHETLRSTYRLVDGRPIREIVDHLRINIDIRNIATTPERPTGESSVGSSDLDSMLRAEAQKPFDLQTAPLVRVTVFQQSAQHHVVLLVMHHIISDGWSMAVMLGELAEAYRARREGTAPNLPQLHLSYRQFAAEQRQRMTDDEIKPAITYWQTQLADCTETLDLPTDFDRPPVQDFEGATLSFELPEDLTQEVLRLAKAYNATPFTIMLAAYAILLSRLSNQNDFNVGTAVANRPAAELESLIGFFVGTMVLRMRTEANLSFADFLDQVRETTIEAFEHSELPFEKMVETVAGKRDRSHSPLFQAALVMQNTPRDFAVADGLELAPRLIDNGTSKYDLTLFLWEQAERLSGYFEYRTRLFQAKTIQQFGECLQEIVRSVAADPRISIADISILTNTQRQEIIRRSMGDRVPSDGPRLLHEVVRKSVERYPERLAVRDGEIAWTYAQLYGRCRQMASGLQKSHVLEGDSVMLYMQRSADQIAAQMAVMMVGAVFIPVDTSVPPTRIATIVEDANCKLVLVDSDAKEHLERVLGERKIDNVVLLTSSDLIARNNGLWNAPQVAPDDLAYMIFTSGSTGKPKGVLIEHAAICNFVRAFCERVELTEDDCFLNNMSPSFDGTLSQTFTALSIGAAIEVVSNDILLDPERLTNLINERGVTFAACTPSMFASLDSEQVPKLRKVLSAGEALTSEAAVPWMQSHQLYNGYGPTECTIGSAIHPIKPGFGRTPPIGRPLTNMSMYVLDRRGNLVPDGVIGDVYIGGAGVGRGYLGLPELTAEKFVPDPFASNPSGTRTRMYATGDLGRWNQDGFIEIVGRGDNQIKLRGFRIEPGEIAAAMEQLPEVKAAAVLAWGEEQDQGAGKRLVGYFVAENDAMRETAAATEEARNLEQTHIDSWRKLFDQSHQQAGLVLAPEDDFSGWQSVISGDLIPLNLMREWADQSAARIRRLQPNRILEIGCGTGLILLRLGESFQRYDGLDVLPSSIEQLKQTVSARSELKDRVHVQVGLADQLESLPHGLYDTIVLNSVVQYFPSVDYFMSVLEGAIKRLARSGKIFLGDLRDLRLHGAFATEVELARGATETLSVAKLRRRVTSRMEHDEELLLDPSMFQFLSSRFPRIKEIEILSKIGSAENELNRYRFDVILHFDDEFTSNEGTTCYLPASEYERDGTIRREWLLWNLLQTVEPDYEVEEMVRLADRCMDILANRQETNWDAVVQFVADAGYKISPVSIEAKSANIETWGNNPLERRRSLELVGRMRDRLREKLPEYMIPSAFVPLDRLPLTVQGKLDKAALPPPPAARPEWAGNWKSPTNDQESILAEIWEDLLEVDPIGIEDDFFDLGGHSMLAVRMMAEVERRTGTNLPLAALFQKATIAHLASLLRDPDTVSPASALIPLAHTTQGAKTTEPPLFCIHPAGGTVFCYKPLAGHFDGRRAVYGLQARGVDGREPPHQSLEEMAQYYADAIKHVEPEGPYHLVGWSLGGNIAFEVARRLSEDGDKIGMLALLDSGLLGDDEPLNEADFLPLIVALFPGGEHLPLEDLRQKSSQEQLNYFIDQASQAGIVPTDAGNLGAQIFRVFQANIKAVHHYRPSKFSGKITLVRPKDQMKTSDLFDDNALGWEQFADEIEVLQVPGDHAGMLRSPAVDKIAEFLR